MDFNILLTVNIPSWNLNSLVSTLSHILKSGKVNEAIVKYWNQPFQYQRDNYSNPTEAKNINTNLIFTKGNPKALPTNFRNLTKVPSYDNCREKDGIVLDI